MNKKLIALAVAASFAAPLAAHAETTPYANIQFELTSFDDGKTEAAGSTKGNYIVDEERGQIGLKGSEDLGNGLKAIAKAEFDFVGGSEDSEFGKSATGEAGNGLRIREIFAGLSGGFGEVQIGTLKSAYKYTGGVAYDAFVATTLEARKSYGMSGLQNGFINNALAYKNKFGALGLWVTYSPDDSDRDSPADGKKDAGETTVGVNFTAGNLEVIAAYYDAALSGTNKSYTNTKVGAKFNMGGGTAVMGQYEMKAADAANADVTNTFVAFHLGMGANTLVVQYGIQDRDETVASNDSGTMLTVGGIHKFSKNSRVFAGYKKLDGDAATNAKDDTYISVGLRVDI